MVSPFSNVFSDIVDIVEGVGGVLDDEDDIVDASVHPITLLEVTVKVVGEQRVHDPYGI